MNPNQRKTLFYAAIVLALLLIFPPFLPKHSSYDLGWFFSPVLGHNFFALADINGTALAIRLGILAAVTVAILLYQSGKQG